MKYDVLIPPAASAKAGSFVGINAVLPLGAM
jgi:hypothetical protein